MEINVDNLNKMKLAGILGIKRGNIRKTKLINFATNIVSWKTDSIESFELNYVKILSL
jgi:hypothetical protein